MFGDPWIDRGIGLINTFRTAFRRIDQPEIGWGDLVLDIGCGDNPHPRADVACDFLFDDWERGEPLVVDRPFFWADSSRLPLRSGAFDYAIMSHVLEHVRAPGKALDELQRISRAGYIETPNAFHEFAIPYTSHLSRCTLMDGKLRITFKERWNETLDGPQFADVRHDMQKTYWDLHDREARALLTIFHWKGHIDYEVCGTPIPTKPKELAAGEPVPDRRSKVRRAATELVRFAMRPHKKVDLPSLLACPLCHGDLVFATDRAECPPCRRTFRTFRSHLDFRIE
ncbi:MAG: methyltransferase domain-containing protein [Myxococcales bacterium]